MSIWMHAGQLMKNLMEQAAAQGIRDHVIWLDKYVATEELLTIFQCTSVYLTPFDEITPTSVRLQTAAMSSLLQRKQNAVCLGVITAYQPRVRDL